MQTRFLVKSKFVAKIPSLRVRQNTLSGKIIVRRIKKML